MGTRDLGGQWNEAISVSLLCLIYWGKRHEVVDVDTDVSTDGRTDVYRPVMWFWGDGARFCRMDGPSESRWSVD